MPLWINSLGIGGIGVVYGYVLFYVLKRYMQPITENAPTLKELVFFLGAIGASEASRVAIVTQNGETYIGPYGLGFFIGAAINIVLSLYIENRRR